MQLNNSSKAHNDAFKPVEPYGFKIKACAGLFASAVGLAITNAPIFAATSVWSPEQIITSAQTANVRTSVNKAGVSVVVWDQFIPGSADAAHLYGRWQVYASVCTAKPVPQAPLCAAPEAFTGNGAIDDATNAGAVVAPNGKVTVFWNVTAPALFSANSSSADNGANWSVPEILPGSPGYSLMSGVYSEVGQSVGVDGKGNIVVAMINPPTTYWTMRTVFGVQTLVKDAVTNVWSQPQQLSTSSAIFGSAKLFVNSDGQALLNTGFTTFRRQANGTWGAAQTVPTAGMGQIYSASAGFDAGGKAYFVYRNRYGGAYLSTSTPTLANPNPVWTTPRRVAKFDTLGSSLLVRGSSANHAIIYGNDMNTGNVRAAVTADGGATWGALVNFGLGSNPRAAGSENGLYALSWDSAGINADRFYVAGGTGIGTGNLAWSKINLIGNNATGPVAIAGDQPAGNARIAASWLRWDATGDMLGFASGTITP